MEHAEEWRPVVGFEGLYEVSSAGRVCALRHRKGGPNANRVLDEPRLLHPRRDRDGYFQLSLTNWSRQRLYKRVHHLVLEAFVGPRPQGLQAAHLDGNPSHNGVDNLAWVTGSENCQHRRAHGTFPLRPEAYASALRHRGESNRNSKLVVADVVEIRRRVAAGEPCRDIAPDFGVTPQAIRAVAYGKVWAHVPGIIPREAGRPASC